MDTVKSPESSESKLHFLDYWRIIRLRKTVILAVFLLVVLTTVVITMLLKPTFASMVRISVEKDATDIPGIGIQQMHTSYDPFFLQTEFEKIQSRSVLNRVIRNLDLPTLWSRELGLDMPLTMEQTFNILQRRISVKQSRNTSLIEIWVYSRDKDEAAKIANEIAAEYRELRKYQRNEVRQEGVDTLEDQLKQKTVEILAAQKIVDDMRRTNNIPDLGHPELFNSSILLASDTVRRYEQARIEAELQFIDSKQRLDRILDLDRMAIRQSLPTIHPDQHLSQLLMELATAEQSLAGRLELYGPQFPEVKQVQEVVNKIDSQVQAKVDGIILGIQATVLHHSNRLAQVEGKFAMEKEEHMKLTEVSRPYLDQKRHLEQLQHVRDLLQRRIEQERIELLLPTITIVTVTDDAVPALQQVRPKVLLNVALGIVVGLIVGVGLAFFIEYLDTSVKTIDDVERALQAPVLAVIPQNVGALIHEGPESPHAEAYRVLRTNLLFSRKHDGANTVTVVSGGAGEGKSTTLFNLATVFAQSGHRVLVVDSDLRRPSIHKILKVSNSVGLTNYLLKQNTLEEVIQTTLLPTLDFLPSGKLPSSSMGILSSLKMKDLIAELKRRYDFVFFDSPPLLGVSDASILASEVDLVLQVIQYRRYPQPMTIRAKQMIQKVGGTLAGIVLNNINVSQDENYYYYSGYYYDYYSKHEDEDDAKKKPDSDKKAGKEAVDIKSKF